MIEVWKEVSGYPNYQVSNLGSVRRNKNGKVRILKPQLTEKGYARVTLRNTSRKGKHKKIHRLVGEAFLTSPINLGQNHINHKDGIKLNNRVDNLEWATIQENMDHAMENSLITRNIKVRVYDTLAGTLEIIPSIGAAANRFGIGSVALKRYLGCYPDLKLADRYLFEPLLDGVTTTHYPRSKAIAAFDYVTSKLIVADNLGVMTLLTGIANTTIENRVTKGHYSLTGGYVFKYLNDPVAFPEHTVDEARASREKYLARRLKVDQVSVEDRVGAAIDAVTNLIDLKRAA